MLFLIFACSSAVSNASDANSELAHALVQHSKRLVVLDVRTPAEFDAGHIEGAVNMDIRSADFQRRISTLEKDRPVLVHCQAGAPGGRSRKAVEALHSAGVHDLHHLDGGYAAWTSAGHPVVSATP